MHYPQTLKQLAEFFVTFATSESEIEAQRIKLSQLEDFDPQLSFQRIDRQNLGYITVSDLLDFLRKYDAQLSDTEIFSFYEMFDSDADQRLSYADFLEAVLPTTNPILRQDITQRHSIGKTRTATQQTDINQALANFLQTAISFYHRINLIKRSLITSSDWDAHEAFVKIDKERTGFIDRYCLLTFLKQYTKFALSFDELLPLYRIIDTDNDGKLCYPEFQAVFIAKPLQQYRPVNDFSKQPENSNSQTRSRLESSYEISHYRSKPRTESPKDDRGRRRPPPSYQRPIVLESREVLDFPRTKIFNESPNRQNDRAINDHLKQLVDNALRRSQETRARSMARSTNRSMMNYQLETSKDEISMVRNPRSSLNRSRNYEEDTRTRNRQLDRSQYESRRNIPADTTVSEEFQLNTSGYVENPRPQVESRSELKTSKTFSITPIPCSEENVDEDEKAPEFSPNEQPRERSQDQVPQKDSPNKYESLSRQMQESKWVFSSPEERKKLVGSIVAQYANPLRARPVIENYIPGDPDSFTEAVTGVKVSPERPSLTSMSSMTKAESPYKPPERHTPIIMAESKYRTPNRSRAQRNERASYWEQKPERSSYREQKPERSSSRDQVPERSLSREQMPERSLSREQIPERSLSRERQQRNSPLSPEKQSRFRTEDLECFAKALREIAELDEQLESIRKVLAFHSDFTIIAAYEMLFPKLDKNYCSIQRFTEMLNNRGFNFDSSNIRLVFSQFDRDRDGNFSLRDFEHLIKTRDADAAEVLDGRRSEYIHKSDTRNLVNQFMKMAVVFEISLENIRQKLKQLPGRGLEAALREVDMYGQGYLTIEEVKELAARNGVELQRKDLRILALRFDPNDVGKISLSKFIDELVPKSGY